MKDERVSFEIAQRLKDIGYPQTEHFYYYDKKGQRCADNWFNITRQERICACPTLSFVQKWFRENKRLFINVTAYFNDYIQQCYYEYVAFENGYSNYAAETNFERYEDALSKGIEKTLEVLESRQNTNE